MKKSLLALAVLGSFAAVAQAQTSVTIYGVIDTAVTYQSKSGANNNSLFAVTPGGLSGSRLGFKGSEDLGNGLKANFQLEMGFSSDTGALDGQDASSTALFRRTSTVGLSGGFGSVNVGRQTDFAYSGTAGGMATFSHAGYVNSFSKVDGNTQARLQGDRTNNSIRYDMPAFGGLNGGLLFGLGEQAGGGTAGQAFGAGLKYDNGPLAFGGSYYKSKVGATPADRNLTATTVTVPVGTTGATATTTYTLGGSYNFGFGKLYGNVSRVRMLATGTTATFNGGNYANTSANDKLDLFEIGYNHNLTASLQLLTGYAHTNVSFNNGTPQGKLNQVFIGTDYFLSKRTDLYAVGTYVKTSDVINPLNLTTSTTPANAGGAFALGVGIRHAF